MTLLITARPGGLHTTPVRKCPDRAKPVLSNMPRSMLLIRLTLNRPGSPLGKHTEGITTRAEGHHMPNISRRNSRDQSSHPTPAPTPGPHPHPRPPPPAQGRTFLDRPHYPSTYATFPLAVEVRAWSIINIKPLD